MSDFNFTLLNSSPQFSAAGSSQNMRMIYFLGKIWLYASAAISGVANPVYSSSDGITWSTHGPNTIPLIATRSRLTVFLNMAVGFSNAGGANTTVFKSLDGLAFSNSVVTGMGPRDYANTCVFNGNFFYGGGSDSGGSGLKTLWKSADLYNWFQLPDLPVAGSQISQLVALSDRIIYYSAHRFWQSLNEGLSWQEVIRIGAAPADNAWGFLIANNDTIYMIPTVIGSTGLPWRYYKWTPSNPSFVEKTVSYLDGKVANGFVSTEPGVNVGGTLFLLPRIEGFPSGDIISSLTMVTRSYSAPFPHEPALIFPINPQNVSISRAATLVGVGYRSPKSSQLLPGASGSITHARILKSSRDSGQAQSFHDSMRAAI